MRLLIAAMLTETNTFSACPTGRPAFEESGILRGNASADPGATLFGPLMQLWRDLGFEQGWDVTESLCTFAQPAGITPSDVYCEFKSMIVDDARAAGDIDIVLLALHGAMVAADYEDCEGDLTTALREVCGSNTIIGAVIDPHCHLTQAMLDTIDIIVAYKEYPHSDVGERSLELFDLCRRTAAGEVSPVTRAFDCQMMGMWRTLQEPGKGLVEHMKTLERRPGVLSVSFGHGFPWADVTDVGARCWAVTDNDADLAHHCALDIAQRVIATREQIRPSYHTADSAIDALADSPEGLVVMADMADNPGGGGMSDSTFILQALLDRGVTNAVLGLYWDPGAMEICINAGVGAKLKLRLGGKCGPESGDPVDLSCSIREIRNNHQQPGLSGAIDQVGTAVWLECGGLDLVLSSIRSQVFSPEVFTELGINLTARRLVVVKSIEHFSALFSPIAADILYVDTPGALGQDFAALPYTRRDRNYWPCLEEPRPQVFPRGTDHG